MILDIDDGGEIFSIALQRRRSWGTHLYAAVDVRYTHSHNEPKLSRKYRDRLERCTDDPGALERIVFLSCQQRWWAWAATLARSLDLGSIEGSGHNSTWLILASWSQRELDRLAGNPWCAQCGNARTIHADGGKCLYAPTWYQPIEPPNRKKLHAIRTFQDLCTRSVENTVPHMLHAERMARINEAWSDYQAERRRRAKVDP